MKKILVFILVVIFISTEVKSQDYSSTFYISPGLNLSWGGNSTIIFGWKISVGYLKSEKYYINLTFGNKHSITTEDNVSPIDYQYWEIQYGNFWDYYPLSAGGGLGIICWNDKIYPKISLFGGALFFVNLNYIFKKNFFDLGGSVVLPIPFSKEYRDLGPG